MSDETIHCFEQLGGDASVSVMVTTEGTILVNAAEDGAPVNCVLSPDQAWVLGVALLNLAQPRIAAHHSDSHHTAWSMPEAGIAALRMMITSLTAEEVQLTHVEVETRTMPAVRDGRVARVAAPPGAYTLSLSVRPAYRGPDGRG